MNPLPDTTTILIIQYGPSHLSDPTSSYTYGGGEYASPGPGTGGSGYYNAAMANYELSADYVDSTTAYDPRPTQQVDAVAADTGSVNATGVMPSVVTTGEYQHRPSLALLCSTIIGQAVKGFALTIISPTSKLAI